MLFLVVVTALLCSSTIQAGRSISHFYPQNIGEASCTGSNSWTKYFNTAKPSDNGNFDQEVLAVIQAANGRDVCETPLAMQAQSVSELPNLDSFPFGGSLINNVLVVFKSGVPDLDFQIRFCCPNTDFIPTTTTTTTPRPLTSSTCGRAQIQHSLSFSRIFGGSVATPNSWPWQVLYEERKSCGDNMICLGVCGGTLIDSLHVLTAAHCIGSTDPSLITITAGLHNKHNSEADTRQLRKVERIFKHAGYDDKAITNDITILRLSEPVEFNKFVQPACLPGPDPQPDADVALIGWGKTVSDGAPYHELKQAKVKVIGDCNRYWGQVNEEQQVCVGNTATGDSACQGDSGGPMLYERNGQWVVAGITSFGSPDSCTTGATFMPNVYTRVSAYLPWINSII